jgi:hypothetical protein
MKKLLLTLFLGASLFVVPVAVFAQAGDIAPPAGGGAIAPPAGGGGFAPPATKTVSPDSRTIVNPLGVNSICGLIKALLGAAIAIGIPIAVLFIVYAGLKFVLARGNGEKLAEARQNMLYTVIGIAIFLGAWLLASVIANTINALASGGGSPTVISCN